VAVNTRRVAQTQEPILVQNRYLRIIILQDLVLSKEVSPSTNRARMADGGKPLRSSDKSATPSGCLISMSSKDAKRVR
jgi:hypothetical protein